MQVQWRGIGVEQCVQYWLVRVRVDWCAGFGGDLFGGRVGLLGCEFVLFDGFCGGVACCEHVFGVCDVRVFVDC